MTAVLFTFAAMAGALVRVALRDRFGRPATTAVNLLGSFLFGAILAGEIGDTTTIVLCSGFCGSLTTMSGAVAESLTSRSDVCGVAFRVLLGIAAAASGVFFAS